MITLIDLTGLEGLLVMPRFSQYSTFDHRIDNQVIKKEDLRFHDQGTAEEFATAQYSADSIPRSVILGLSGLHIVLESPYPRGLDYTPHPREVFYINSMNGED